MGVDLKKVYMKVAEAKQTGRRGVFLKVSKSGTVLGINGTQEKVTDAVKNLYASKRDIIDFSKLGSTDLSKYHLVVVGSHDKKDPLTEKLKKYVEDGGFLLTTDKSLDTIVSELFPDMIAFEKEEIKGGAVKGEISSLKHPFIRGATKKKTLKFWIEDKSHPIKKIRPDIENIVTSKKLEKKYGSGAMMVALRFGDGMLVYMMPKLHPSQSNEEGHLVSAHILTNILDEAVQRAIQDEIRRPTDANQMAYVNLAVLDDPSSKCLFCGSTFADFEGKVFRCSSCGTHYHEFCIEQQLSRDGICTNCKRVMIYEKFKGDMDAAMTPQPFQPPAPPPEKKEKEEPPPPPPE